ncbi:hypothetical protein LG329_04520 [Virgibacillus necropolis]|uniref:hypothetical protein n=1 Tax=Virgibacillus necropolis TaxID=163877 RepID=UPI0038504129
MRKKYTVSLLFVLLVSVIFPAITINADLGEFEYDDGGLKPTEMQQGDTSPGDHNSGDTDIGDADRPWWEKGWDKLKEIGGDIKDTFIDVKDTVIECGKDVGQCAQDIGDWAEDTWNDFADSVQEWWDGLPDFVQDLIKTVGAIIAVVAAIAALVALGVIGLVVGIVAAVGAIIAGIVYLIINGGTDNFSFMGVLTWSAGGALAGGLLSYFGAGAAIMTGLRTSGRWLAGAGRNALISGGKWIVGASRNALVAGGRWLAGAGRNIVGSFKSGMASAGRWIATTSRSALRGLKSFAGSAWRLGKSGATKLLNVYKAAFGYSWKTFGNTVLYGYSGNFLYEFANAGPNDSWLDISLKAGIGTLGVLLGAPLGAGFIRSVRNIRNIKWGLLGKVAGAGGLTGGIANSIGALYANGAVTIEDFAIGAMVGIATLPVAGFAFATNFGSLGPATEFINAGIGNELKVNFTELGANVKTSLMNGFSNIKLKTNDLMIKIKSIFN